jgi:hypothetical protein
MVTVPSSVWLFNLIPHKIGNVFYNVWHGAGSTFVTYIYKCTQIATTFKTIDHTTTQMILWGGALLLTEAVTKSNRLVKCPTINGDGRFFTKTPKNNRLIKSIYRGGHFIYRDGWKMPASKNRCMEAIALRQPPPKKGLFLEAAIFRRLPP